MYRRILLPTDGSDGTERVAEHAVSLARATGARLYVLHVVDTSALPLDAHSRATIERLESDGLASVEAILDRAAAVGIDSTEGEIRYGVPFREILDYADEHGVDLIVMGTHGRGGVDRVLLGSVAERVIRLADGPVLTVRTGPPERT